MRIWNLVSAPKGNIDINYNKQYADVKYWIEKEGYLDYIMPQVYYGFKNSVPFAATVEEWADLASQSDVDLYIGLAAYKIGQEDQWAGEEGMDEWIVDGGDLLKRQLNFAENCKVIPAKALPFIIMEHYFNQNNL